MNVIGFDDGPFDRNARAPVLLVGAVCAGTRLDGVVSGQVERDGDDATDRMIELVTRGTFRGHIRAVMLQGIAVAGFNVVDVHRLSEALTLPVLVVARRQPDLASIRLALFGDEPDRPRVPGAADKWRRIERAGPMEILEIPRPSLEETARARAPAASPSGLPGGVQRLWTQRARLSEHEALELVRATTLHGQLPEPLRLAHMIAGGVVTGQSRGRA